jgi:hypothetical protein
MGLLDDTGNFIPGDSGAGVKPITGSQRKVPMKVGGVTSQRPHDQHYPHHPPKEEDEPRKFKEQTGILLEAVDRFNEDSRLKGSCYRVRLWDRGEEGFHLQVVCDTDNSVVHEMKMLKTADIDHENIEKFTDEFIREKGLIIDVEK